ncbi:MAG: hypothetical protein MZV70_40945 [Desulfobacterales bacterium]|nr:hypothetical protein [Desulfobacterales bacterium]
MVQDRKKLRPGVVGGKPGVFAFSSEICGLDAAIPAAGQEQGFSAHVPGHGGRRPGPPGGSAYAVKKDPLPLPH